MKVYENAREAVLRELGSLLVYGDEVTVRGMTTKEAMHNSFTILNPTDRLLCVKHRNGNPFAQIAETLWVLAGRDDLDWLERYIPGCKKWSDNGKTWRAGYGPRLRAWEGRSPGFPAQYEVVDQLAEVVNKLKADPFTRQAVISIWDPAVDWVEGSKDYPCNNWLHFLQRYGKLHLNVAVRSNDVIFGFSHVDFFCWSFLQQIVAHLCEFEVGQMTWNASSFHIYERHYDKAQQIVDGNDIVLKNGAVHPPVEEIEESTISIKELDRRLSWAFGVESIAKEDKNYNYELTSYGMVDIYTKMLVIYNYWLNNKHIYDSDDTKPEERVRIVKQLVYYVEQLPYCTSKVVAIEYFARNMPGFTGQLTVPTEEFKLLQALHII